MSFSGGMRLGWVVPVVWGLLVVSGQGRPRIAPVQETGLEGTNSVVYCPTLVCAWDGVRNIVGGPVQMERPDDLLNVLNDSRCLEGVLPENAYPRNGRSGHRRHSDKSSGPSVGGIRNRRAFPAAELL